MEFDITHLDKVLLIQTLYLHASPHGMGELEYYNKLKKGEPVEGLSLKECQDIIQMYEKSGKTGYVIDYYNGKPIKFEFFKKNSGQIICSAYSFDSRNGKFAFLEALLNIFDLDEIILTKLKFQPFQEEYFQEKNLINEGRNEDVKGVLNSLYKCTNEFGKCWRIDEKKAVYTSKFVKDIINTLL